MPESACEPRPLVVLTLDQPMDLIIHPRVRLAIMAFLARTEESSFIEIAHYLNITDGALGKPLQILRRHGLIQRRVVPGRRNLPVGPSKFQPEGKHPTRVKGLKKGLRSLPSREFRDHPVYSISPQGRQIFADYLARLESMIRQGR